MIVVDLGDRIFEFMAYTVLMYKRFLLLITTFAVGAGAGGFVVNYFNNNQNRADANLISARLREGGGTYTNPLLMCDVDDDSPSIRYIELEKTLDRMTSEAKAQGIETSSIYFRDFTDSSTLFINPDERYTPASLNKVPLMITALHYAEIDSSFLNREFVYQNAKNANAVQLIQPTESLKTFSQYTVEQAIESMIVYSDNGAYDALTKFIDYQDYLNYFRVLKIPIEETASISAKEYSYFLRVLYNSTLLSREMSEKALGILAKSTYSRALKAGVPSNISVAHKFGASGGVNASGNPVDRQLHDCGIVYAPKTSYLLCVMTKSNNSLSEIEQFIAEVSKVVYEDVALGE